MMKYCDPNRNVRIVTRKIFTNFYRCADSRALKAACEGVNNAAWQEVSVRQEFGDPEWEYLRQWLLANGAEETDDWVLLAISPLVECFSTTP